MMGASGSSSPLSYYTAPDSDVEQSTTASSPAHATPCAYREARQPPRELKEHCQIFLEEQLCTRPYPFQRGARLNC